MKRMFYCDPNILICKQKIIISCIINFYFLYNEMYFLPFNLSLVLGM